MTDTASVGPDVPVVEAAPEELPVEPAEVPAPEAPSPVSGQPEPSEDPDREGRKLR